MIPIIVTVMIIIPGKLLFRNVIEAFFDIQHDICIHDALVLIYK